MQSSRSPPQGFEAWSFAVSRRQLMALKEPDAHRHAEQKQVADAPRLAYGINECCIALGISRPTMYDLIRAGRIRTVMISRRRVVPIAELERLLNRDG